ncbi:hypothetical protein F503_00293 [Ophiostoma piceae UAMH 11346]|uniref:Uncharacterized protein n=1 Tax=Ophiostoma piceae (strain UAMH 11346) TaxID=1262450 RepID=S3C6P7_OPHP1|nr:hypothetical protein F503_00293 [Ophiostoma piceae UAMH 11346]
MAGSLLGAKMQGGLREEEKRKKGKGTQRHQLGVHYGPSVRLWAVAAGGGILGLQHAGRKGEKERERATAHDRQQTAEWIMSGRGCPRIRKVKATVAWVCLQREPYLG